MAEQQSLTVPGRYDEIQRICKFVADGARGAGLDDDDVFHIELCCDEASTNIIEHSYGAEDKGEITINYEIGDEEFKITLYDNGRPFNPDAVPKPQMPQAGNSKDNAIGEIMDSLQVGGLGIHFIRKLMDEVHYDFNGPRGNTLVLVKYLPPGEES